MSKPVFHYFNAKAMGEPARLLFAFGGEEFVDHRFTVAEWPAIKPSTPFGQVPVLELDGKKYAQSLAIARYLGRRYGLVGQTMEEDLEIDQNVDFINDIRRVLTMASLRKPHKYYNDASEVYYEKLTVFKEMKHEDNVKNLYPGTLNRLDEVIKANDGYIALRKLTWADFFFAGIFDYLKVMLRMPDLEKKYPSFKQVIDHVYSIPNVQKYSKNNIKLEFEY